MVVGGAGGRAAGGGSGGHLPAKDDTGSAWLTHKVDVELHTRHGGKRASARARHDLAGLGGLQSAVFFSQPSLEQAGLLEGVADDEEDSSARPRALRMMCNGRGGAWHCTACFPHACGPLPGRLGRLWPVCVCASKHRGRGCIKAGSTARGQGHRRTHHSATHTHTRRWLFASSSPPALGRLGLPWPLTPASLHSIHPRAFSSFIHPSTWTCSPTCAAPQATWEAPF